MHSEDKSVGIIGASPTPSLATLLSSLSWGGSSYPSYEGRNDVSAPAAAPAGAPPTPPAAAPAGTGTPASAPTASPAANGQPQGGSPTPATGAPQASPNDENLRTLRQNYETLKPWETVAKTVKDPNAAVAAYQRITALQTEGSRLAEALGYTADSYAAAFAEDPVGTLSHLRGEFAKANPGAANAEAMARMAEEAARRATQPLTQQLNQQKTAEATQKLESEINRLVTDEKLGFGPKVPDVVKEAITDLIDFMIPDQALIDLKMHGKTAGIAEAFNAAKARFVSIVNAYNEMMNGGAQPKPQGNGQPSVTPPATPGAKLTPAQLAIKGGKPLTLDDILGDPEGSLPGLGSGKYS